MDTTDLEGMKFEQVTDLMDKVYASLSIAAPSNSQEESYQEGLDDFRTFLTRELRFGL